jgi:ribose 5-phosphate isomerase B
MLEERGIGCRVVSMPSWFLFDKQPQAYQDHILSRGKKILRVSLEAGTPFGWSRYVGDGGITLGVRSFGESAPADVLYDHFHLKAPQIVSTVLARLDQDTVPKTGERVFKKLVFASDHRGFALKEQLRAAMEKQGWLCEDVGTFSGTNPVDYPDFVSKATRLMGDDPTWAGVFICGSGVGMSIAANRFPGIRAALCHTTTSAQQARHHNNGNVLVLGAGSLDGETAQDCLDVFLTTPFEGGRHIQRLEKLETYSRQTSEERGAKQY